MKKRNIALFLALALVFGVAVGGTIAYLTDKTEKIENVFTTGNVDIDLTETTEDFTMSPGATIEKDPKVTVKASSEDCWLFVKIEESANLDDYITYGIAEGWTLVTGESNVYWREGKAGDEFSVLAGDEVEVLTSVTNEQMDAAETTKPTLTFTAYAIQKDGFTTAAAAWAEAKNASEYNG